METETHPRIGSLFSGYGGLEMGVQAALGGSTAWHVEYDKAPSKILARHWPDVPNYGDVTAVDWSAVEPVDIITGGSPCQDLSGAGKRAGMTEGTRSNLWVNMREGIAQLRPGLVVWENVRGAYSAAADSDLEFCPGCMGGAGDRGTVLRALGRVLGDLSDLGYDCRWHGLRAADVGAPHGRFRVFVVAADTRNFGWHGWPNLIRAGRPSPLGSETSNHASNSGAPLLPTPAVNDMGEGKTVEAWDAWTAKMQAAHGNGNGHGKSLAIEAQRLLPTPMVVNRTSQKAKTGRDTSGPSRGGPSIGLEDVVDAGRWGEYAAAVARWECLTRPAPAPTQLGKKGAPSLSPAFSEWMMGVPAGHITDTPGLSRADQLKAAGNGVVPQQAEHAIRAMLA